ncbi:MAG: tetratricopeptide repeat protein [Planctomycetaceae bacterium]|jgi:tetratricopeptide (TPR) repeat protein|nr:tetratricopeptide repeat protein [Planctomycetaceae bacterium]
MNRFIFFFFFPISFFCTGIIFGFTESDILFLHGLSDRNLFESVEFFCAEEFQNPNVSAIQKTRLAAELVHSRTRQLLLSEPVRRQEFRKRLDELKTQFLDSPDELNQPEFSFARILLQLQLAITEYSLGDWQRLEADVVSETDRNKIVQQARTTLLQALEQLQQCTEQLEKLRQKTGLNTDSSFEHQYLILFRSIGYQTGLSQMSLALTFPPSDDRIFSLNRAVDLLTELASLPINDPIIFRSRLELATCYRLLGNYDKCKELLTRLQNTELSPELQFQAESELIRYYLAVGNLDEANQKAGENPPNSSLYPDYSLAKLELFLALSRQLNDKPEQQTKINQMILEQIRRIDQQFGTYWGRRARMFLGTSHLSTTEGMDAPLLKMLAEDQFQNGQYTEAIRFFELASRRAEIIGDRKETFNNAVSAIAILGEVLKRLETVSNSDSNISQTEITACRHQMINLLRNISIRFPENPEAAELHLKAVDLTAQAVLNKETPLDNYLILLKEHAEYWSDSPKIPPLLFRAAVLLESQNQKANALSILEKISNHSVVGLDVVNTAKRCFKNLSEPPLSIAEWFERRLPVNQHLWNEADVVSAIYAAEQQIQAFARAANKAEVVEVPKKTEQLLRNILQYFPEPEQVAKIKVQTMLVTVLNDQGRMEEGTAILQELEVQGLDTLPLPEKRDFLLVQIQLLAKTGKVQEAVNLLKKQLKQYPDDLPFLILLAEILTQQNDSVTLAKSIEVWTRIANQSVKNTENWWLARERIIEIYLKLNKKTEAKKEFELLRLLYPEFGDTTRKKRLETQFIP